MNPEEPPFSFQSSYSQPPLTGPVVWNQPPPPPPPPPQMFNHVPHQIPYQYLHQQNNPPAGFPGHFAKSENLSVADAETIPERKKRKMTNAPNFTEYAFAFSAF